MGVGAVLFIMDGEGSPKGPREVSLPLQNGILAKMITSRPKMIGSKWRDMMRHSFFHDKHVPPSRPAVSVMSLIVILF